MLAAAERQLGVDTRGGAGLIFGLCHRRQDDAETAAGPD